MKTMYMTFFKLNQQVEIIRQQVDFFVHNSHNHNCFPINLEKNLHGCCVEFV